MPQEVELTPGRSTPEQTAWRRWKIAELKAQGLSNRAIASEVKCSVQTVMDMLEATKTQTIIRTIRADIMSTIAGQLSQSAIKAIRTLEEVMETGETGQRARAASDILTHFRALTADNVSSLSSTPELVFAALPLMIQTIGPQAVLDAVAVVSHTQSLPVGDDPEGDEVEDEDSSV